ncbi:MAG: hypothetical protein GTO18_06905 [Anaerolineales bacterium]|nr:hypothetical protein [Anaerolineales bacterium]
MASHPALSTHRTIFDESMRRTKLSRTQIAGVVTMVILLLLVITVYLDTVLDNPIDATYWVKALTGPVIICFLLLTWPILEALCSQAMIAIKSVVQIDELAFHRSMVDKTPRFRRGEWFAVAVGMVIGNLILRPWSEPSIWLGIYLAISGGLMFSLIFWLVYNVFMANRQFARMLRRPLRINFFDLKPLESIARWSLGITLTFMGSITLSMLFLIPTSDPTENLKRAIIFGALIMAALSLFFINLLSTHRAMVKAKNQELEVVHDKLEATSRTLKGTAKDVPHCAVEMEALSKSMAAWVSYEKWMRAAPEWPCNRRMRGSLLLSMFLPVVALILAWVVWGVVLPLYPLVAFT